MSHLRARIERMVLRYEPAPEDRLFLRPRGGLTTGRVKARILAIQADLVEKLRVIDEHVQELVDRRSVLVDGLRQCRDALGGKDLRFACREPLPGEVHATPIGTREVRGADLRDALRRILREAARPLTIEEADRGLRARGMHAPAPVAKLISNAFATEVRRGRARRVGLGEYVSAEGAGG